MSDELWKGKLTTEFAEVDFYAGGLWMRERHVDDPDTLKTTIDMSASRMNARAAIWQVGDEWLVWVFRAADRPWRAFPTREAAEMFAIHHGGR